MKAEEKVKINYFRLALNSQGVQVDNILSEQIIATYKELDKKGGKLSINDIASIQVVFDGMREKESKKSNKKKK